MAEKVILKTTLDNGEVFALVECASQIDGKIASGYFEVYYEETRIAYCHITSSSRRMLIDEAIEMYMKAVRLECYRLGDI